MRNLLIMGIVLTVCFVGTASDTVVPANSYILFDASQTLESSDLLYSMGDFSLGQSVITRPPPTECQHPKLKALGDKCWGNISRHEYCPTEYRQRAYKCRECKKKIVILQAILIESKEKAQ